MKHVSIVVPEGAGNNLSSISGAFEILTKANALYNLQHGKQSLIIELVAAKELVTFNEGLFDVRAHRLLAEITQTDLIIVPSVNHAYVEAVEKNAALVDWIGRQYALGAEVASICTGAFLVAATGLLNGRHCSVHWSVTDQFRLLFPAVKLQPDKLITDENGLYTNGGAYSFLNLMIYLVDKLFDHATALLCTKIFQIEPERNSQSQFAIFTGQKLHGDDVVAEAQAYIEQAVSEKISVEELSARFAVGRRNFDRRFLKATGNTPIEYAQRVKVESAKKAIECTRKTINEIMYDVGYNDVKAFREVFRKITGLSPLAYRNKFGKLIAA